MSKQIGILGHPVILALASAAFVLSWSSGFLVAKIGTVDASVLTLLVWRFLPLAAVLVAVAVVRGDLSRLTRTDLRRQATIGLLGQFGYCVSVYAAIALGVASGTTALIDAVQPILVATLVGPILGLRVRGAQWLGLLAGGAGVFLVVASQSADIDAGVAPYLFPVLAMVSLIVGTFIDRRAPSRLPVVTTLTVHVAVTAAALVAACVATNTFWPPPSPDFWLAVVFAAVVPTLGGYGLYWWLLRRVGVTALNALLFLVAPTTALAGALMFGEPLTAVTVAGFALCGGGVALVLVGESRGHGSAPKVPRRERVAELANAPLKTAESTTGR